MFPTQLLEGAPVPSWTVTINGQRPPLPPHLPDPRRATSCLRPPSPAGGGRAGPSICDAVTRTYWEKPTLCPRRKGQRALLSPHGKQQMLTAGPLHTRLPGQLTLCTHSPLCLSEPRGYAPAPLGGNLDDRRRNAGQGVSTAEPLPRLKPPKARLSGPEITKNILVTHEIKQAPQCGVPSPGASGDSTAPSRGEPT